jgi:carbon storage regulator CsrA
VRRFSIHDRRAWPAARIFPTGNENAPARAVLSVLHFTEENAMLVLNREVHEKIILRHQVTGETITVEVAQIRGGSVRLGTTAPREWKILRDELEQESTR